MNTVPDVINKITKKKRTQDPFARWLLKKDPGMGNLVSECGSWLKLREFLNHDQVRVKKANFCKKHTLCQWCAYRRGMRLGIAYVEKAQAVMIQKPKLKPIHITLTIKNTEFGKQGLQTVKDSFSRMLAAARKAKSNPVKNKPVEWNKVLGGVKSVESTNKGNGWHAHLHIFALVESYIDREKLSEEWARFNGGEGTIVYVSRIYAKKHVSSEDKTTALASAMLEVIKYPTKFDELPHELRYQFFKDTKGFRITDPFGIMRGIPPLPDFNEDDMSGLDGPYRDYMAFWRHHSMRYDIKMLSVVDPDLDTPD